MSATIPNAVRDQIERAMADPERMMPSERAALEAKGFVARAPLVCDLPPLPIGQQCAVCGCTDDDCSGCIRRTGVPCYWIAINLCSACEDAI
jgi:hypothetical protein